MPNLGYQLLMAAPFQHLEQAPALNVYGEHAARMAGLARLQPSLVPRFFFAPRRAVHVFAAWLSLSERASLPDKDVATIIEEADPRALLIEVIPNAPPTLFRALDRAGNQARSSCFYSSLGALCSGPLGMRLLQQGALDDARLSYVRKIAGCDPVVVELALRGVLPQSTVVLESVQTYIQFLRAYGVEVESLLQLPAKARIAALHKRLRAALFTIRAPEVSFNIPEPFRIVQSVGELQNIGRRLDNCLAGTFGTSEWYQLAGGSAAYITSDTPPMIAALLRVGRGVWQLREARGPSNARVPRAAYEQFLKVLRDAGLTIIHQSPRDALSTLNRFSAMDDSRGDDLNVDLDCFDAELAD